MAPQQQEAREEEGQGGQQGARQRGRRQQHGSEVGSQGSEHGAGHQLGQAVAGQELLLAEAVPHALPQQGSTTWPPPNTRLPAR